MATTAPEIILKRLQTLKNHPTPDLKRVDRSLVFDHFPSRDGIDSNLLILLHGLGDTLQPFSHLGQSLYLPQTAVLALQAPKRVPLLEEDAYQWWDSFDSLGEIIHNPNPTATLSLLTKVIEYLCAPLAPSSSSSSSSSNPSSSATSGCAWHPSQLHLVGFVQGGSCAAELALHWSRTHSPESHLGSVISISAPLLSHPTLSVKARTRAAVVYRRTTMEERMVGVASWKKGFESVKEIKLEGGRGREGMPRGMDEWREIMRFWSETLLRRSATEMQGDVYEIAGGVPAAEAAGAKPPAK
ncbi:hypothetical protein JCM11641_001902 [Rhodosporidiobolus odoratus]